MLITSAQNPRVKATAALRDRKERERTGLVLVEGGREIARALRAGLAPTGGFICEGISGRVTELVSAVEARLGRTLVAVTEHVFDKLAVRDGSDGLVVTFERPRVDLGALHARPPALLLAVHGVEKPGNLGALMRTADGAGASGVVALEGSVDPYAPQAIRASLGTVFSQPVIAATSEAFEAHCRESNLQVVAAALRPGSRRPWEVDFTRPTCILLGAEATGLPESWLARATAVEIPMRGLADSLNVAAAGAMLLYEALRQRAT
jgi:TrmH family RNA methyltransferase